MFEKLPISDKLIHKSVIYEVPIHMIISERCFMREYDTVSVVKLATSIRRIGLIEPIILRYPCSALPDDPEDLFSESNDLVNVKEDCDEDLLKNCKTSTSIGEKLAKITKNATKMFDKSGHERKFLLISGGYRLRACKMLGMNTIPARFALYSEKREKSLPVVGDFFGSCSDMFEKSKKYVKACVDLGMNACDLAENLGFQQRTALSLFNISKLTDSEADLVSMHKLSFESVAQIARLPYPAARIAVIEELFSGNISEKELGTTVNDIMSGKKKEYRQSRRFYCRDLRIYTNTIKKTVDVMNSSGFDAQINVCDSDDGCVITVDVKHKPTVSKRDTTQFVENSVENAENFDKTAGFPQIYLKTQDEPPEIHNSVENSVENVGNSTNEPDSVAIV